MDKTAHSVDHPTFVSRRQGRLAWARRCAGDGSLASEGLGVWSQGLVASPLAALVEGINIPDSDEVRALCGWAFGSADSLEGPPASELVWDQRLWQRSSPEARGPEDRKAAALFLLRRLGEEFHRREVQAWEGAPWKVDDRDGAAAEAWAQLFSAKGAFDGATAFARLWGEQVRRCFVGVGVALKLPREVADENASRALENLPLLPAGMHHDIASRVLETLGEPVRSLAAVVPERARPNIEGCVSRWSTWSDAYGLTAADFPELAAHLSVGSGVGILLAVARRLEAGSARYHDLGLPGWGVVRANRQRMRGRLRAFVSLKSERVAEALGGVSALYARTAAAVSRHAWAWAWREARSGFGLSVDGMRAAPCGAGDFEGRIVPPIGGQPHPQVATFLLLSLARGTFGDVRAWVEGAASTTLSKAFYRCLKQLPDELADPMEAGQRVRRYSRLRSHLLDVDLPAYAPHLCAAAAAVSKLEPGRSLGQDMKSALGDLWDQAAIPFPNRGLPAFLAALKPLTVQSESLSPFSLEE